MNDSISPVECTELSRLETISFNRAVPSGPVEIVHSMRDKAFSCSNQSEQKEMPPSVTKNYEDHNRSSKRAQKASIPVFAKVSSTQMTLKDLENQGFVDLARKLKAKSGPPWDDILNFGSPHLIEQLFDLASLIEIKYGSITRSDGVQCMNYGLTIASKADIYPSPLLGMFIHLLDRDPERACKAVRSNEDPSWIKSEFHELVKHTKNSLARDNRKHRKAKLQNHEVTYRNQLPIELSYYLISSTKNFNIGVVAPLTEAFIESQHSALNYEMRILLAFKQLGSTPSLREKLCQMKSPESPTAPANIVIRTTLDLPPDRELSDLDSSRTALTSILTLLRQGKDGSCFATPLAISLMNSHLDLCLSDLQQLVAQSKLARNVEGVQTDFPFLLRIGDQNLSKKVRISRTGRLILPGGRLIPLSKVPGMIAVKTALGIEKIKITKYLFSKSQEEQPYSDVTLKELLQALVKQAKTLSNNEKTAISKLYLHAVFAYEAQECNPLLQVWENSIACMAEADDKSMVRSAIIKSSNQVLANYLKQSLGTRTEILRQATSIFNTHLNEKIHLQWDPHISTDIAADQRSSEGAFVLYDKGGYNKPSRWQRLDTPKSYQSFILRAIDESGKEMRTTFPPPQWKEFSKTLTTLEAYVESDTFLLDSLIDYYPPNGDIPLVINQLEHISYTPWITKSGNNLHKVMQIYFEKPDLKASAQLSPKNGEELLLSLIHTLKYSDTSYIDKIKKNPNLRFPLRIPYVHAFTFLPGHPTFSATWSHASDPADWIKQNLLQIGWEISTSSLPMKARESIIQQLAAKLIHRTERAYFISQMRQLPENLNIMEFRQEILNFITKQESGIKIPLHTLEVQTDQQIYTFLPDSLKKKLHASAIHIADTNWADGVNAIHFSLVVNPGTGQIVLWGIRDDSLRMIPLDQSVWFEKNWWELFVV